MEYDRGAAPRVRGAFQGRWIHKSVRRSGLQLGLCGPGVLLACHVAHLGVHVLLYRCFLCRRVPLRADAWAASAAERAPCRGQPMALGFGPPRAGELGAVLCAVRGGYPRARARQLGLRRYLRRLSARGHDLVVRRAHRSPLLFGDLEYRAGGRVCLLRHLGVLGPGGGKAVRVHGGAHVRGDVRALSQAAHGAGQGGRRRRCARGRAGGYLPLPGLGDVSIQLLLHHGHRLCRYRGRQRLLCFGGFLRPDAAYLRCGALGKCGSPPAGRRSPCPLSSWPS